MAASEPELTDEQINQLVLGAERRSSGGPWAAASNSTTIKSSAGTLPGLPNKQDIVGLPRPYVEASNGIARIEPHTLLDDASRKLANAVRKVEDPLHRSKNKQEADKATAGPSWFDLPRTNLTPELSRDLQLLRMRSTLDPKRFYKKESSKAAAPRFSQIGTVIEGPTDFFSGRLTKRERRQTLAQTILANERSDGRLRRQYLEVQQIKTSGKKADYKRRVEKRYGRKAKG